VSNTLSQKAIAIEKLLPFEGRWRAPPFLGVRRRGVTVTRTDAKIVTASKTGTTSPTPRRGHLPSQGRSSVITLQMPLPCFG
jgi:hypothetical protein